MSLNDMYETITTKEEMAKSIFLYARVVREMAMDIAKARYGCGRVLSSEHTNRIIDEYFKRVRVE